MRYRRILGLASRPGSGNPHARDVDQTYVDWDLTSFEAFMLKRQEMLPDERLSLWRFSGSWEVTSDRETPSMGMIHMTHYGSLLPIWEFLDKPSNESLPLLSLEEFTDIVRDRYI